MLYYSNYDIVFQEFPDEITLAINLCHCTHCCLGCHSPQLQIGGDEGKPLTMDALEHLFSKYSGITCIALMGDGDNVITEAPNLLALFKPFHKGLRTGWYTGYPLQLVKKKLEIFEENDIPDYIKTGPYVASLGGLSSRTTNQQLFRITDGVWKDITWRFWKTH